jgi:parallel beta-helix repeat protein
MKVQRLGRIIFFLISFIFTLFSTTPAAQGGQSLRVENEPSCIVPGRFYFTDADGEFRFQTNYHGGVSVFFNTQNYEHFWILEFSPISGQPFAVGTYLNTIDDPYPGSGKPGLFIGGDGRSGFGTGSFEITQLQYNGDGSIGAFAASFEYHCGGGVLAVRGDIQFNPNVTITAPAEKSLHIGNPLSFEVTAAETNSHHLTLTAADLPTGASFVDNGDNTGTFTWTPTAGQGGIHHVGFRADNGSGDSASWITRIAVGDVIRVPADVATIQEAIDKATDEYTVWVAPGTYLENINFNGKAITVASEKGPKVTIIDGNGAGPVATFTSGEAPTSILDGFTLTNGVDGVFTGYGSSPTILNNVISANVVCSGRGAIEVINSGSPIIRNNIITNNRCDPAQGGAGIAMYTGSDAQIIGNEISGHAGAGIYELSGGTTTIQGNIIHGNQNRGIELGNFSDVSIVQNLIFGNKGAGIYWLVPAGSRGPRLVNNTIVDNDAQSGSAIFADGFDTRTELINNILIGKAGQTAVFCGNRGDSNPPIFRFNNVFSPGGSAYGGICSDQTGLNGNISADPRFLDPANGDYRLDIDSPVTDAGDNTAPEIANIDLTGRNRFIDGDGNGQAQVDMGAYEFAPNPGFFEFAVSMLSIPEDAGNTTITVLRRGGKSGAVAVDATSVDITATAGSDYLPVAETLYFGDGETQKSFFFTVVNDQQFEGKESFNLRLGNPSGGAALGARQLAVVYITEPGVLAFTSSEFSASENGGCAVVAVQRTSGNSGEVTVHYATSGGTATPGVDYTPVTGTLTFADGETTKTFCVPLLSDALVEGTETIGLALTDATGGALFGTFSSSLLTVSGSDFFSADYFPASPGGTWNYRVNGSGTSSVTVLSAPTLINGVATAAFQDQLGYKEFYTADGEGIRLHGLFMPKVPIQGLGKLDITLMFSPPVLLASGVADIGQTVSSSGMVTSNPLRRIGVMEFPYTANFAVAGFDNIDVPAGNFDVVRLQGRLEMFAQTPADYIFELAKGIGIVRSSTTQDGLTDVLELISTNVALFTVDAATLPDGEQGVSYRASLAINGISPPYSINVISGALPAGLSIDDSGYITGVPSRPTTKGSFTVQVTQRGSYVNKPFKINIFKPVSISSRTLKTASVGKSYSASLKPSGGKAPFNWTLESGALPAGLVLNGTAGSITGTPSEKGSFPLTIRVNDSLGGESRNVMQLTVK